MKPRIFIYSLFIIFPAIFAASHDTYHELPETILNEVEHLKTSRKASHNLTKAIKKFGKIPDRKIADDIFCQTCDLVIQNIITYQRSGVSRDTIIKFFKKLCDALTDWGPAACAGYINIEIDTVLYIINNKQDLTASRACSIYFQNRNCIDPYANKWKVHLPHKRRRHHQYTHYYVSANPLKILHLTDFHFDPLYAPGSNAACDEPLCCQTSNGPPSKPQNAAGFWGDYHICDMPWHSVTNFTSYLTNKKEKYDYVYYTGDIISHKSWDTNKDSNTAAIQKLFRHFNQTFQNVTVYPILGNHEPHPTDFYSPDDISNQISTRWLFDLVATEWVPRWLPNSTLDTIHKGGYYTVLTKKGYRIIALNSNVCFTNNLWLIYDDEDPYDQLKWLTDTLSAAETNGEKVHILSHIPPGDLQCLQRWGNQFRKIINRFAPIISAQFNGHTHLDELRLFRDLNNTKKIVNVAYNAGSFTTFVGLNPNYRTYDIDPNTYRVLDYQHYMSNLTEANMDKKNSPKWVKLYSFKDAYGLQNTTNEGLADLVERMEKNHTLVQQYFRFQGRESPAQMAQKCDETCLRKVLCGITAVEAKEALQCQFVKKVKKHSKNMSILQL